MNSVCLNITEGMLTGEAKGVYKDPKRLQIENPTLASKTNCLFQGTFVNKGSGVGMVLGIGSETEMGKIGD